MSKLSASVVCAALAVTLLAGCDTTTRQDQGAVIGGVVGAAVGSTVGGGHGREAAMIVGAIAGTMIGTKVGQYMDEQDRRNVGTALEYNRTGETIAWRNPDTSYNYDVTPTRTYASAEGPCREFTMDAYIGGKKEQVYGTACRKPDGSWEIVK